MARALCVSASKSNEGKTLLTTALLAHYKQDVRAYKMGPDYIDPQFHSYITGNASINLDGYLMDNEQLAWMFYKYFDKEFALCEGVMGFYDGADKQSSAYDVTKVLNIPTLMLLDASGTYITLAAILKGLCSFREDNTIKAVILNNVSSNMHYTLIKNILEQELPDIKVLGWIKKDLTSLKSTYLGLDLKALESDALSSISQEILENIDLKALEEVACFQKQECSTYPFKELKNTGKRLAIVKDKNFSFLYHDNIMFLKELFDVEFIDATKDEVVDADILYIPGGYVETPEAYERIKKSECFKQSVQEHAKTKAIYAECAGLLYLGESVEAFEMSKVLELSFHMRKTRKRLGYYTAYEEGFSFKGHAFHYSEANHESQARIELEKNGRREGGGWRKKKITATYLHSFFRTNPDLITRYFLL